MKKRLSYAAIAAISTAIATAQKFSDEGPSSAVNEAIQQFQNRAKGQPNEIKVVLDPPTFEPAVVTEKPPADIAASTESGTPEVESEKAAPKPQPSGLAVRIERLQSGQVSIDPSQIKLVAPFAAKPLSQPPAGWRFETPGNVPPFTREVEIAPGSEVTLTIRPHVLVPDSDGAETFTIAEPGYQAPLGYLQSSTVGAILSGSIRELDENSKNLGTAIDRLQQILISLPKAATLPEIKPAPARNP